VVTGRWNIDNVTDYTVVSDFIMTLLVVDRIWVVSCNSFSI